MHRLILLKPEPFSGPWDEAKADVFGEDRSAAPGIVSLGGPRESFLGATKIVEGLDLS